MVHAIALAEPALAIVSTRIRREQHPARAQACSQPVEDARQLGRRHVKQRRVREDTVEARRRQVESQKVLVIDVDACVASGHLYERKRAVEPDGAMPALEKRLQVPSRTTAEIENALRPCPVKLAEQRVDVLRDVVVPGPVPESVGARFVVVERLASDLLERGLVGLSWLHRNPILAAATVLC